MASGSSQSYGGEGVFQFIEGFVFKVAADFLIRILDGRWVILSISSTPVVWCRLKDTESSAPGPKGHLQGGR